MTGLIHVMLMMWLIHVMLMMGLGLLDFGKNHNHDYFGQD
jgi:hypothetical protein